MYSRNYANTSDGTVRAFENAYAKEEFLKKCASGKINEVSDDNANGCENQNNQIESIREGNVQKCRSAGLFGGDAGDLLILLLIIFFFFDGDKENDILIPVLLALILLF